MTPTVIFKTQSLCVEFKRRWKSGKEVEEEVEEEDEQVGSAGRVRGGGEGDRGHIKIAFSILYYWQTGKHLILNKKEGKDNDSFTCNCNTRQQHRK